MKIVFFIKYYPIILISIGLTLVGFTFLLVIFKLALGTAIKKYSRLTPDSVAWELWTEIPFPIYRKFYFFNITNPDRVFYGEKPKVKEIGPYVYFVDLNKEDLKYYKENETVRYRQRSTFYFEPEMSSGPDTQQITFINLPFATFAKQASNNFDSEILKHLDKMLSEAGEKLTKTAAVKDILFDGFSVQPYLDLLNDPLVKGASKESNFTISKVMEDGRYGLLKGKNNSFDPWLTVHNGVASPSEVGEIVTVDGQDKLSMYKDDTCNSFNGTDGTIFAPFMNEMSAVYIYVPLVCRSLKLEFERDVFTGMVPCGRFSNKKDFLSTQENPDNWCFCLKEEDCNVNGIIDISPCHDGAPLVLSKAHFLDMPSDSYINRGIKSGLSPNKMGHDQYIDFHMMTAIPVDIHFRFQMNIQLTNYKEMHTFEQVTSTIVPFVWLEETSTQSFVNRLNLLLLCITLFIWDYFKFVLSPTGVLYISLGAYILIKRKSTDHIELDIDDQGK